MGDVGSDRRCNAQTCHKGDLCAGDAQKNTQIPHVRSRLRASGGARRTKPYAEESRIAKTDLRQAFRQVTRLPKICRVFRFNCSGGSVPV